MLTRKRKESQVIISHFTSQNDEYGIEIQYITNTENTGCTLLCALR